MVERIPTTKMDGRWRIWIEPVSFDRSEPDVFLVNDKPDGHIAVITSIQFKRYGPAERVDHAMPMANGMEFLRVALNAAWEAGLRPDGYLDTRESMKATQAHLEDMRRLVFDGHVESHTVVETERDEAAQRVRDLVAEHEDGDAIMAVHIRRALSGGQALQR